MTTLIHLPGVPYLFTRIGYYNRVLLKLLNGDYYLKIIHVRCDIIIIIIMKCKLENSVYDEMKNLKC